MNKLLISFVLFFCTVALLSCSKKGDVQVDPVSVNRPLVDYAIVPGDDPFTFKFENTSKDYKELEWRFGDDSLSTAVSPEHVYLKPGIFDVTLKATSADGSTAKKLLTIKIVADSVANFFAEKTAVANTVKFSSDTKATIKSFKWTFHDGTTSTDANPEKTYIPNKFFDATLDLVTAKGSVVQLTRKVTTGGSLVEITDSYLRNVNRPFKTISKDSRWGVLADWTVTDAVKQRPNNQGSVDGDNMSMESWCGEAFITNGKIYQTLDLKAGTYYMSANFNDYTINGPGNSYMVMAEGGMLPDVNDVPTKPVGSYYRFTGTQPLDVVVGMTIANASKVSLGFSATMEANCQNFRLNSMKLYKTYK
ncbi:PKD repeat protein [Pedobacter sp. UYEF25]